MKGSISIPLAFKYQFFFIRFNSIIYKASMISPVNKNKMIDLTHLWLLSCWNWASFCLDWKLFPESPPPFATGSVKEIGNQPTLKRTKDRAFEFHCGPTSTTARLKGSFSSPLLLKHSVAGIGTRSRFWRKWAVRTLVAGERIPLSRSNTFFSVSPSLCSAGTQRFWLTVTKSRDLCLWSFL